MQPATGRRLTAVLVSVAWATVSRGAPVVMHARALSYGREIEEPAAGGRVSYFIVGKHGAAHDQACEDGIFFDERYLVVVDGATDKSGHRYDGKRSGRVVRDLVLEVFSQLEADLSPAEVVERLNARIQRFYAAHPQVDFAKAPINRATASLIWYSFARNELVALGDCRARVDGRPFNARGKLVDEVTAATRKMVYRALPARLAAQERARITRRLIAPLLAAQFRLQNNPKAPPGLGYWVLDGFPVATRGLMVWKPPRRPRTIELSSDGYPDLPPHASVAAYERLLATSLQRDPYRVGRYASTKGLRAGQVSFDDRALLIWRR